VLTPLKSIGLGFVSALPNLFFLAVLVLVVRFVLKIVRAFFSGIDSGRIRFENFDRDWAIPTYKILRVFVIAFSIVVAYPYIPGSDSMAFKGVSVLLGVLLSLGSSSFIANTIAGLTKTYRGAFKEGDLVRVGDVMGRVEDIKLMVTRVRTAKNEMVILPNSNILNTDVVNYSSLTRRDGLMLHTTVGIGYDTPSSPISRKSLLPRSCTAICMAHFLGA
jgi:small-conductance mechanosensitive channel